MSNVGGTPFQTPTDAANEYKKLLFIFNQLLKGKATAQLVTVLACTNDGGIAPSGTVDVQILCNQVDGAGAPTPHGPMYNLPYFRLQGGTFAVIIDPVPGDIGVAVFASRDISAVVSAKGPANPASDRIMDYADGLYIGGFLNGDPTSYVAYTPGVGIQMVDPVAISLQAPQVTITASSQVSINSPLTAATGDVTAEGTSLHNHIHAGQGSLMAGSTPVTGNTAKPT